MNMIWLFGTKTPPVEGILDSSGETVGRLGIRNSFSDGE